MKTWIETRQDMYGKTYYWRFLFFRYSLAKEEPGRTVVSIKVGNLDIEVRKTAPW